MTCIKIKTEVEIELMRTSGELLGSVFAMLDKFIQPGISIMDINDQVERFIVDELAARPVGQLTSLQCAGPAQGTVLPRWRARPETYYSSVFLRE